MTDYFENPKVLVVVDLSQEGWSNLEPVELLSSMEVVLLGLYQITDQVSPEQARAEFEEEARERLDQLSDRFESAGVIADCKLLFSVNFSEAIDRVVKETDCNAVLSWNEKTSFSSIGVLLPGDENPDHVLNNVAFLMIDQGQQIELVHFIDDESEESEIKECRAILNTQREYLVDRGISDDQITIRLETTNDVDDTIAEVADEYDAVVMGETEPSVKSKIFGSRHKIVKNHMTGPVLVVRNPHAE